MAADGFSYERNQIGRWLEEHANSPVTNLPLEHRVLTTNHSLRETIRELIEAYATKQKQ